VEDTFCFLFSAKNLVAGSHNRAATAAQKKDLFRYLYDLSVLIVAAGTANPMGTD